MPPEVWQRWKTTLARWLSLPGVAAWWQAKPTPFGTRFAKLVEAYLKHPVVDTAAALRWQAFVANSYLSTGGTEAQSSNQPHEPAKITGSP